MAFIAMIIAYGFVMILAIFIISSIFWGIIAIILKRKGKKKDSKKLRITGNICAVLSILNITPVLLLVGKLTYNNLITEEDYKTPEVRAEELQSEIMKCFINKDSDTLKSYFSEYIIENYPDIDTQIEEAFDFIDGEIVSYDDTHPGACGSIEEKNYGAHNDNILTNTGATYMIYFNGWLTNSEDSSKIGVSYIKIVDLSKVYSPYNSDIENGVIYIGGGY